jgi:TolA-binding protein
MFRIILITSLVLAGLARADDAAEKAAGKGDKGKAVGKGQLATDDKTNPQLFRENLSEMLKRTEKSIKLIREQIVQNQNVPFLADLYLNLGELLSQKANVLYYIQMERENKSDTTVTVVKGKDAFSPVTEALMEAIGVYKNILKDFKQFDKRKKVYYLLAVSLKSVDEIPLFIQAVSHLIQEFPASEEAIRARLLLGQHYYDKNEYRQAMEMFVPVSRSPFPYERDLAKYRMGLIWLSNEKFRDALKMFEEVSTDEALKEEDTQATISLKTRKVQSNLKREALIDSVRAYTNVFPDNGKPVEYYERISPTEALFQEVIEKLALRYINIKKYEPAVRLLRTLSERTAEPQKIINIYQEVLLLIPIRDRIDLPVQELRFVLEKYNLWLSYYEVPKPVFKESYNFFEKQIRDLATRSHEMAKSEPNRARKFYFLGRARDYYQLYLGFFRKSEYNVKLATNLADVYFAMEQYQFSGDYYLRVFLGEFGPPQNQSDLIQNAILCAEKKGEYSFFDQLRVKGLMIKAVQSYMAFDPKKKSDPKLNFVLCKARYEQGFYTEALGELLDFMQKFPHTHYAADAGELILDYYNARSDFEGLVAWADRILRIKTLDRAFLAKVSKIKDQAESKKLQEYVKKDTNYDAFEQGKSYLKIAENTEDRNLASLALRTALAKSRSEQDLDTYLQTAGALAAKEPNAAERTKIRRSIVDENIRVTRFETASDLLKKVYGDSKYSAAERTAALDQAVQMALLMQNVGMLAEYTNNPLWNSLPPATKNQVATQLVDIYQYPIDPPSKVGDVLMHNHLSDNALLTLYKGHDKMDSSLREKVQREIQSACVARKSQSAVCKWEQLERIDAAKGRFLAGLQGVTSPQAIEPKANEFVGLQNAYGHLEGSGDPQLDMILALRNAEIYRAFGNLLNRVGARNPDFKQVLAQKAQESITGADQFLQKCRLIIRNAQVITPTNPFCQRGESAPRAKMMQWESRRGISSSKEGDPSGSDFKDLQKQVFVAKNADPLLELAQKYYQKDYYNHAVAAAKYGVSVYKDRQSDFKAVLGCSLLRLGFLSEANYHLKTASDFGGMREKCQGVLRDYEGG